MGQALTTRLTGLSATNARLVVSTAATVVVLLVAGVLCCVAWASVARAAQPVPNVAPTLSVVAAIAAGSVLVAGIGLT